MFLNLEALQQVVAVAQPFPYLILPNFIPDAALEAVEKDFPAITKPGSFPLETLTSGPAFAQLMAELRGQAFRKIISEKLCINLENRPVMITVRGQAREKDGQIHTDSKTKLVTVLIYMNGRWENPGGRLRLLHAPDNLEAVIAEVPPDQGTLLAFVNKPNAWHGHTPFHGQRRAIQLNWVTNQGVVWREKLRHRFSAFVKRFR